MDRVRGVTGVVGSAESEGLIARHRGSCLDLIAVIDEQTRAQMKCAVERKPVKGRLHRPEVQVAGVVYSVLSNPRL
jgi:hypothetical protein